MTIKQNGGIFGRNPTFNDVTIEGELTFEGDIDVNSDLKVSGDIDVSGDVIVNSRTYYGIAGFWDNAVNGNNKGLKIGGSGLYPTDGNGSATTGVVDIGTTSRKFKDVHLAGNVIVSSGSGIDFSATSGTGTSELFDDYEEGTWTPTFEGSTSGSLAFSSVIQATYFKIGKLVYVSCYLASGNIAGNTVSGNCLIKGLPYTGNPYSSAVTVTQCNLFTFDEEDISISGYCEGSNVRLVRGSRGTNITDSDVGTAGTAGTIMFQMTYGAL